MNLILKYKNLDVKNKVRLDVLLVFIISLISIFLPFREYYDDEGTVIKIESGLQSTTTLFLFIYLTISSACLLSLNRTYVRNSNILISIFLFFNFVTNNVLINMYVPYGPIAPQTKIGYWIFFFSILYLIIKGIILRHRFEEEN